MPKVEIPKDLDFVRLMPADQRIIAEDRLKSISPDDGKYGKASRKLEAYLSPEAEWRACVTVQGALLETRLAFADDAHKPFVQTAWKEFQEAAPKIVPLNISFIEDNVTMHDQLAVLAELGRFMSKEGTALLHPGTTSYDVLDTARAYLFRGAWGNVIRDEICRSISTIMELSDKSAGIVQVGRTHLQNTSPVPLALTFAQYAARLADRVEVCDRAFTGLRGKISGIVGTGAGIEMVVGQGRSMAFEAEVLKKLNLLPDYTATQIVQKERLADVGHALTTLMHVLGDFSNDMRMLYSSAIGEVTSRANAQRLGGSSTDATKNNPINWENICGKVAIVEAGMRVLYAMIKTDFQRDLRNSVQARYQPQGMMAQTYEAFARLNKSALPNLSVNEDRMAVNLQAFRNNPSEAMVTILRGQPSWVHPKYGLGHDFVKEMGKIAQKTNRRLCQVAMEDPHFAALAETLTEVQKDILAGAVELYVGSAVQRTHANGEYARSIVGKSRREIPGTTEYRLGV